MYILYTAPVADLLGERIISERVDPNIKLLPQSLWLLYHLATVYITNFGIYIYIYIFISTAIHHSSPHTHYLFALFYLFVLCIFFICYPLSIICIYIYIPLTCLLTIHANIDNMKIK